MIPASPSPGAPAVTDLEHRHPAITPAAGVDVAAAAQQPTQLADQSVAEQIRALRYALGFNDDPVLVWRLYRIYRVNGMPIPDELSQQLDRLAESTDRGVAAVRATDTLRRAIALLDYADAIEDGERPTRALLTASERSGISVKAIKTMASRRHIRTRPYRISSGGFNAEALRQASDPFGLAKAKVNKRDDVASTHTGSNIATTVDSIHDPPDTARIQS